MIEKGDPTAPLDDRRDPVNLARFVLVTIADSLGRNFEILGLLGVRRGELVRRAILLSVHGIIVVSP